jgi:hypothetical protein
VQRVTNNISFIQSKDCKFFTISQRNSLGRTAGIGRGNKESTTKGRFNCIAKAQKVFANLDLLYCKITMQNKCFVFAILFGSFRSYTSCYLFTGLIENIPPRLHPMPDIIFHSLICIAWQISYCHASLTLLLPVMLDIFNALFLF